MMVPPPYVLLHERHRSPPAESSPGVAAVPRPHAVDLHIDREAEHDSDQDDPTEHGNALEGLVDDDRATMSATISTSKAEEDRAAEIPPQLRIRAWSALRLRDAPEEDEEGAEATGDHDRCADRFDDADDIGDCALESHLGATLPSPSNV